LHRCDDIHIPGAAAQVARKRSHNLRLARIRIATQQINACHDHARGAKAALQRMALGKGTLDRVGDSSGGSAGLSTRSASRKSLDRDNAAAVGLDCKKTTGLDRLSIEMDRAASALAGVAANVGACESKTVA
jgi:hypothetical protein